MSAISEVPRGPGVLQYTASRPAVPLPPHPSEEELAFDWTLSERDIAFILTNHRGAENLCRLAVQLCVLRKHGRFLANYMQVSPAVLGYLCRQLDLAPLVALAGQVRGNTESDYQRDIAQYLGWRPFDVEVHAWLREWIVEQVVQHLYVEDLVEQSSARLRTHRIVLPGRTVFERTVNAAHADAEHRIFAYLTQHLSAATTEAMDRLLGMAPTHGSTAGGGLVDVASPPEDTEDFYRFAAYPPEAKAKHILTYLQRYGELSPLDLTPLRHASVSPELLQRLSTAVQTYDAQQLQQFAPDKRHALAAAFLFEARKRLLDYLVEMHAQFMTEMQREARNAWEKEHRQARPRVRRGVTALRGLAETVLAMVPSPDTPLATLLAQINPDEIAEAVKDCVQFEQLERHGLLHILHGKYPNFRRYFRAFVDLPFAAEPGSEGLLASLALLRQLNSGEVKELPLDVETSFVPAAWRGSLHASHRRRRWTWEMALALALKDALRSGDMFVPDSRRHVSFWHLCYDCDFTHIVA